MKIKHLLTVILFTTTGFAEGSLVEKFDLLVREEHACRELNSSFHEIHYKYEKGSTWYPAKITIDYFGKYIALHDPSSEVFSGTLFVNFKSKKYYIYNGIRGGTKTIDPTPAKELALKFFEYLNNHLGKSPPDQTKNALTCVNHLTTLIDVK